VPLLLISEVKKVSHLKLAQIGATWASLVVFWFVAKWYAPRLGKLGRADALSALLWLHVPRYVTLIMFSSQHEGYPISDLAAMEAVIGDVAGAAIAFAAIMALRYRSRLGIAMSWLLAIETTLDVIVGIHRKTVEPLWGLAGGVTWLILVFYVPLIIVGVPVLVWQLYARRNEPLSS
jgi:hypothetical protein